MYNAFKLCQNIIISGTIGMYELNVYNYLPLAYQILLPTIFQEHQMYT